MPKTILLTVFLLIAMPALADDGAYTQLFEDCARNIVEDLMRPRLTDEQRVDALRALLWGLYAADERALVLRECARK
ncbi:MAG: hypothetical protein OXI73_12085 [Rhodospirillales bacterium]|nr:hypothetical protein [Rhodospirillales bacterium]